MDIQFCFSASSLTCFEGTGDNAVPIYKPKICEDEQNVCIKKKVFGSETIRDCSIGLEGCVESKLLKSVVCACKSHLCNTSFSIKSSVVIQLLALAFAIIVAPHLRK